MWFRRRRSNTNPHEAKRSQAKDALLKAQIDSDTGNYVLAIEGFMEATRCLIGLPLKQDRQLRVVCFIYLAEAMLRKAQLTGRSQIDESTAGLILGYCSFAQDDLDMLADSLPESSANENLSYDRTLMHHFMGRSLVYRGVALYYKSEVIEFDRARSMKMVERAITLLAPESDHRQYATNILVDMYSQEAQNLLGTRFADMGVTGAPLNASAELGENISLVPADSQDGEDIRGSRPPVILTTEESSTALEPPPVVHIAKHMSPNEALNTDVPPFVLSWARMAAKGGMFRAIARGSVWLQVEGTEVEVPVWGAVSRTSGKVSRYYADASVFPDWIVDVLKDNGYDGVTLYLH